MNITDSFVLDNAFSTLMFILSACTYISHIYHHHLGRGCSDDIYKSVGLGGSYGERVGAGCVADDRARD